MKSTVTALVVALSLFVTPLAATENLEALLLEAYENNPGVRAARAGAEGATAAVGYVGVLPNPELEATLFIKPVHTEVGPQWANIMLRQRFPFFGKLGAMEDMARSEAAAAQAMLGAKVRDILVEVKLLYFDLHYYARAVELVRQSKDIARLIVEQGETAFAKGDVPYYDVNRAQAELARLDYDEAALADKLSSRWRMLNALLGRKEVAAMGTIEPLPFLEMRRPVDDLEKLALANNQEIAAAARMQESARTGISLASKDYWPDFSLGATWMVHEAEGTSPDAGQDSYGVVVGLDLPVWQSAVGSRVDEAQASERRAEFEKQDAEVRTRAMVADMMFELVNSARLVKLYRTTLVPQALSALKSAEEESREERSLGMLLERRAVWLQFNLALQRALADYYRALARLEQVVGVALPLEGEVE